MGLNLEGLGKEDYKKYYKKIKAGGGIVKTSWG